MSQFPQNLKTWRKTRRFSQLDLATEAEVSLRHLSFLETGRARPSAEMVSRLGDALELPLAAKNQMLTLAGFAPKYPRREWDSEEMAPVRAAVEYTLTSHAPYPALALDRLWKIIRMNEPAKTLFGMFGVSEGDSLLDLMLSELPAMAIENWPQVAHQAAHRLRTESAAQGGIVALDKAVEYLAAIPNPESNPPSPVIPTIFRAGDLRLSLFATIAQFGTPEDLTLDDMKIELYFPADETTRNVLTQMAGAS